MPPKQSALHRGAHTGIFVLNRPLLEVYGDRQYPNWIDPSRSLMNVAGDDSESALYSGISMSLKQSLVEKELTRWVALEDDPVFQLYIGLGSARRGLWASWLSDILTFAI